MLAEKLKLKYKLLETLRKNNAINKYENKILDKQYKKYARAKKYFRTEKNTPLQYKGHYFMAGIVEDKSLKKIIMKSTQNGVTVNVLVLSALEVVTKQNCNVMYINPTQSNRHRFVSEKLNRIIRNTPEYYKHLLSDSGTIKDWDGAGQLYLANAGSESDFASYTAKGIIVDEYDLGNQINLAKIDERQSHQAQAWQILAANPTIENFGISALYEKSTKGLWCIKCDCGTWINPDFFNHVIIQETESTFVLRDRNFKWDDIRDIYPICPKCQRSYNRLQNGTWAFQKKYKGNGQGFHISKMFSAYKSIRFLVEKYREGLLDSRIMQSFYNGDLGLPYTAEGSRLTRNVIYSCIVSNNIHFKYICLEPCVMGIDVNKTLNIKISQVKIISEEVYLITKYIGIARFLETSTKEIDELMARYNIIAGCIDMFPEVEFVRKLKAKYQKLWGCKYLGYNSAVDKIDKVNRIYSVNRTQIMDEVKKKHVLKKIIYPPEIVKHEEYLSHMEAPVRIWISQDDTGKKGYYTYKEGTRRDDYYHCNCYEQIALKILTLMT